MYQEPSLDLKFENKEIKNNIYKIDPWSGTELAFNLCGEGLREAFNPKLIEGI